MLKFIWGKGHQPNAERLKIQKDLFGFSKVVKHGFPHKPTSMAFDHELKLLAIGTKQGIVRIYGKPGVEYYGQHEDNDVGVTKMLFLPKQGRLVTLTEDNFLHLWEIQGNDLKEIKSTNLEGRLKHISILCLDADSKRVLLGTEGGNIYKLNLWTFKIDENLIYQDIVMQNAPEDFKVNPGAVEGLLIGNPGQILIGYARGLIVLWDQEKSESLKTFISAQQLEGLSWKDGHDTFVSVHNDGSYINWAVGSAEPLEPPSTPYGPYPCKAITKVVADKSWMFFSGGMPRTGYGYKNTVSLMKGEDKHTVFDLTSKVSDFITIEEDGQPYCLMILAEEELVAIDVTDESWPTFSLPYLNPIHASSVTCVHHVSDIDNQVLQMITNHRKGNDKVTGKPWPVTGGQVAEEGRSMPGLLITGHEDGSVKFWSSGGVSLTPLATIKTKTYFTGDELDEPAEEEEEEEWPPFKKTGHFDPYSDDPRLAIKKLSFCPKSGRLFVGATAGQVIIFELSDQVREEVVNLEKADLVTEKEGFTWKGHSSLNCQTKELKMAPGFQPSSVLQIYPPASINSIGFSGEWNLMAAGTAHGLVVFDLLQKTVVTSKCTLNAQDIANADDNPMSRRKSLKKSLRESFRRLRKGRSQRNMDKKKNNQNITSDPIKREIRAESPTAEARPVERAVEARTGSEDGLGSMVRCLHFAHTFIANPQTISATLWAGTNSGQILVFLINIPVGPEKRKSDKASAMLAKEIQLRHRAPVISIQVLDAAGVPIPEEGGETLQPHRVLISSEEQFKMFGLPALKPCGKYKLTAHEGSRVRKVGFVTFHSKSDRAYSENCLTCLTNQGDLAIHSLPDLRRQVLQTQCMKKEDVIGISSLAFTPDGEAFYQCSSSELQRVSMAAANVLLPKGSVAVEPADQIAILEDSLEDKLKEVNLTEDAAKENQLNEKAADADGSMPAPSAIPPPKDPHNDTTVSDISADITVDSVKDHTMIKPPEVVVTDESTSKPDISPEPLANEAAEDEKEEQDKAAKNQSHLLL